MMLIPWLLLIGGPYPKMAPLAEYLMDRDAEIALARSAAPPAISAAAEVIVLGPKGYETAVKGTNGFVCLVYRGWAAGRNDPEFWNPSVRSPVCLNHAAASSQVPITIKRTLLVLASESKDAMFDSIKVAFDRHELVDPTPGAMSYMLSKQQHVNDRDGSWHPHVMFFMPLTEASGWGAGVDGSPIVGVKEIDNRQVVFMIPVTRWSDGTVAAPMEQ
jgi:hypothetical protein